MPPNYTLYFKQELNGWLVGRKLVVHIFLILQWKFVNYKMHSIVRSPDIFRILQWKFVNYKMYSITGCPDIFLIIVEIITSINQYYYSINS